MANTLRRSKFLMKCKFKELWARRRIRRCRKKIKVYKSLLNIMQCLTESQKADFKGEIRVLKIEIMAWKSLLTDYRCPFDDLDEQWK